VDDLYKSSRDGKKEKRTKKERKGGLWKMTALRKSTKDVDSHRALEKPRKRRSAFPHFRTGPAAAISLNNQFRGGSILLDQGGSVLRCQKDIRSLASEVLLSA
jgi:hypothetical protein